MNLNILIVDDSATVRAVIAKTLKLAQIPAAQVHQAADGGEAMSKLETEWIDLVFCDLHMPRMTGIELVERMAEKELMNTIPVVIVSSEGSSERIEELKRKGVRAYIRKPFTPEQMRETVNAVIGAAT
jgi:two-component system chemotaxis response regulator CheY